MKSSKSNRYSSNTILDDDIDDMMIMPRPCWLATQLAATLASFVFGFVLILLGSPRWIQNLGFGSGSLLGLFAIKPTTSSSDQVITTIAVTLFISIGMTFMPWATAVANTSITSSSDQALLVWSLQALVSALASTLTFASIDVSSSSTTAVLYNTIV